MGFISTEAVRDPGQEPGSIAAAVITSRNVSIEAPA
jgi:hypothetical protein